MHAHGEQEDCKKAICLLFLVWRAGVLVLRWLSVKQSDVHDEKKCISLRAMVITCNQYMYVQINTGIPEKLIAET